MGARNTGVNTTEYNYHLESDFWVPVLIFFNLSISLVFLCPLYSEETEAERAEESCPRSQPC